MFYICSYIYKYYYRDNFVTPCSSIQTFASLPIAETTNLNIITITEKLEVSSQQSSESQYDNSSQQAASDNQTMSNRYDDNVITTVSLTNYPSKSQSQKLSHTALTTGSMYV